MKHIVATTLLGLLSAAAFSQNGFYFAPSAGIGYGGYGKPLVTVDAQGGQTEHERNPVFSYNVQAAIGYRYKKWRFQTGVQYVKNGYKLKDIAFDPQYNSYKHAIVDKPGSYKVGFGQIGVPIQVGYAIPMNQKLSFVPYLGVYTSMTIGNRVRYESNGAIQKSSATTGIGEYGWFTGWGLLGWQLEQKLNKNISVMGGMSSQFELVTTGEASEKGFSNLHFNVGISIGL